MKLSFLCGLAVSSCVGVFQYGCGTDAQTPDVLPDVLDATSDTSVDTAPDVADSEVTEDTEAISPDIADTAVDTSDIAADVDTMDDTSDSDEDTSDTSLTETEVACADADGDEVCDGDDRCPGFDDDVDQDGDGMPDGCDRCPGFDDEADDDDDGVADGCERCVGGDDRLDADEDALPDACDCDVLDNCHVDATCSSGAETNDQVVCACRAGFRGDGEDCLDIDECVVGNGGCDPLAGCENTQGSFTCGDCPEGYTGGGSTGCIDVDECLIDQGGCDPLTTCSNNTGSFACSACPAGFVGTGRAGCADRDECQFANGGCTQLCVNDVGAYTCRCQPGFALGPDGRSCSDVNECEANNGGCSDGCSNTPGSYVCQCDPGFGLRPDGRTCGDIDECATNNGGCSQTCTNSIGSFSCRCGAGFTLAGDGRTCNDLDECQANNGGCDLLTICTNTPGSRTCGACPSGYTGNGLSGCNDINECLVFNGGCDARTTCTNIGGGRTCGACPSGYAGNGLTGCTDIDECADPVTNGGCDPFTRCTNTVGGRTCGLCPAGFGGDGIAGCTELASLATGQVASGGATDAEMQAVFDNWRPTLPPDRNELVPQPGVAVATPSQATNAIVDPETLSFDAATNPEVLAWEPGRVVVAGPGENGKNPFGFMRKVQSVAVNGNTIVVTTVIPALEEIMSGEIQQEFDPTTATVVEWDQFDHEWAAKHLYSNLGLFTGSLPEPLLDDTPGRRNPPAAPAAGDPCCGIGDWISNAIDAVVDGIVAAYEAIVPKSFSGNLRLDREIGGSARTGVLSYRFTKEFAEPNEPGIAASFYGEGKFAGELAFNPRTSLSVRIPNILAVNPDPFRIALDIDAYLRTNINIDLLLQASLHSVEGASDDELAEEIAENEEFARRALTYFEAKTMGDPDAKPVGGWKKVLYISKPSTQTIFAGPVPVVFTQTFQLDLECGFEVRANLKANIDYKSVRTFKFKASYESGSGSIEGPSLDNEVQQTISVLGGGEATLSCGLIPRVNAFVYDAVGINLGIRGSGVVRAAFESTCAANSTRPDGEVSLGLYANLGIQFGGRVQVPGASYMGTAGDDLGFDVGPYEIWTREWPIIERTWDVPGLGYCTPTCTNFTTSSAEAETDLDCGGECATGCALDKHCRINRDCVSGGYCTAGSCTTNHCADGVLSGTETDIDCGGSRCGPCPVDKSCRLESDCASGICRAGAGYAPDTDLGRCTNDACFDNRKSAGECGVDCGGGTCTSLCAVGAACAIDALCTSGISNGYACSLGTCANLEKDGSESDIDCGGSVLCNRCAPGKRCSFDSDCSQAAPVCDPDTGTCSLAQCLNGTREPSESDIDCGGTCETKCQVGDDCTTFADCALGLDCHLDGQGARTCEAPTCNDGWKSRLEGDVDCGKGCPDKCDLTDTCNFAADCESDICTAGVCVAIDCYDRVKNGAESDIDCGGSCSRACADGKVCVGHGDCVSGNCQGGVCQVASCADNVLNQGESDLDCGGPSCGGCDPGEACVRARDCASKVCGNDGTCVAPSCDDGLTNGSESDRDCGGTCADKCAKLQLCNTATDCVTDTCIGGACVEASCTDQIISGDESDVDCGGTCSVKCEVDASCHEDTDCDSSSCQAGVCVAPSCDDARLNGDESDIDCGGSCQVDFAQACEVGEGCAAPSDCVDGVCGLDQLCAAATCDDGVDNGTEEGVDCGGPCPNACGPVSTGLTFPSAASAPRGMLTLGGFTYLIADTGSVAVLLKTDGTATGTTTLSTGAFVPPLVAVGSTIYVTKGPELWKTDGTTAGTTLVKAFLSISVGSTSPPIAFAGKLYFVAQESAVSGTELFVSDGTAAGTTLLKDINPGGSSGPFYLTVRPGGFYFVANDGTNGQELWKSDGTSAGTVMVKDVTPGSSSSQITAPVVIGANAFFGASNGVNGLELWTSDGSAAATVMVKDINPGAPGSDIANFGVIGSSVYFGANDGSAITLWKSDGTPAGTVQVAAVRVFSNFARLGQRLAFGCLSAATGNDLCVTDGTAAGTSVLDRNPGAGNGLAPTELMAVGSHVYFRATDSLNGNKDGFYATDGTASGTVRISDTSPFASIQLLARPYPAANGDKVFFAGGASQELWQTDGTVAGTSQLLDINPAATSPDRELGVGAFLGNTFVFSGPVSNDLWKSDGTQSGTSLIKEAVVPVGFAGFTRSGGVATLLGGKLFLFLQSTGFWATDGSAAGTVQLADGQPRWGGAAKDGLYYFPSAGELSKSDGTLVGTTTVKDIRAGQSDEVDGVVGDGTRLCFVANDGVNGLEPWASDGTAAGTVMARDLRSGSTGSSARPLFAMGGRCFYTAVESNSIEREIYVSDGTAAGTTLLKNLRPDSFGGVDIYGGTVIGSTWYFVSNGRLDAATNIGYELWKTDGTTDGTVLVKDINPGAGSGFIREDARFVALGSTVFFVAANGTSGRELWKTDGTEAGTVMVKDIGPGSTAGQVSSLTVIEGALYFAADDGVNGAEIWRSDGTEAGTVVAFDLNPLGGSAPGAVFFHAPTRRLFVVASDGTDRRLMTVALP